MLAKGGAANLVIFAIIIVGVIIGQIVEYFKRKRAEAEARERRLRGAGGGGAAGDTGRAARAAGGRAAGEPARPAPRRRQASGLEGLLQALEERAGPPGSTEAADEGAPALDPTTHELQSRRDQERASEERARAERAEQSRRDARLHEARARIEEEERRAREAEREARRAGSRAAAATADMPQRTQRSQRNIAAGVSVPSAPSLTSAAGSGSVSRDDARRGVLWSVILGRPRASAPYGEPSASDAPGGIR